VRQHKKKGGTTPGPAKFQKNFVGGTRWWGSFEKITAGVWFCVGCFSDRIQFPLKTAKAFLASPQTNTAQTKKRKGRET